MKTKTLKFFAVLLAAFFLCACGGGRQSIIDEIYAPVTKDQAAQQGVTFFYLDGGAQDFPWVLQHQYEPETRLKIDNVLAAYKLAGVSWIRLLVAQNHFIKPKPQVQELIDFLAILKDFQINLVLIPNRKSIETDKLWFSAWLDKLPTVGMVMLGGDLTPCLLQGCDRPDADWIRQIWAWKQQKYSAITASYEVIGLQQASDNDPYLIAILSNWIDTNTPDVPFMVAGIYVSLPPGSNAEDYKKVFSRVLNSQLKSTKRPLWIDEYGAIFGPGAWTDDDRVKAYQGFTAATCGYPRFAWVAGDSALDGKNAEGLVSAFVDSKPVFIPAWKILSDAYSQKTCVSVLRPSI